MIGYDYGYLWEYEEFDAPRLLEVMPDFNAPWWVAGGWALDLWMERESRPHHDVDIAILRDDQQKLYRSLRRWELYYATLDHKLLPLSPERWLRPPIHGVWARRAHDAPWLCGRRASPPPSPTQRAGLSQPKLGLLNQKSSSEKSSDKPF